MANETTNSILAAIFRIKLSHPEFRVCQILSSAANETGYKKDDLFYLKDEQLLAGLDSLIETWKC